MRTLKKTLSVLSAMAIAASGAVLILAKVGILPGWMVFPFENWTAWVVGGMFLFAAAEIIVGAFWDASIL